MATIITDATELQAMKDNLADDYELGNDIYAAATVGWNGGLGFEPVGPSGTPFTGTLDSKGFKIFDLFINRPLLDYIGLFGTVDGATIEDVVLEDVDITGDHYVGALAGYITGGTHVSDCQVDGEVTGDDPVGGFVGWSYGDSGDHNTFIRCSADVLVIGGANTGGFVGGAGWTDFSKCYSLGNVDGDDCGGFIRSAYGNNCIVTFTDCYSRGDVHAVWQVGGFIRDSTVWGTGYVTITNCYGTGVLSSDAGAAEIGGFIYDTDITDTTITACFWDTESTGTALSDGGTGKTTAEMKTRATFPDWDFATIWALCSASNSGYPCLLGVTPDCTSLSDRATNPIQDKPTLELIRNVEMAARGRFFVDEEGNAVYKSRYARNA